MVFYKVSQGPCVYSLEFILSTHLSQYFCVKVMFVLKHIGSFIVVLFKFLLCLLFSCL